MGRKSVGEQVLRRTRVMELMLQGVKTNEIYLQLHQHHGVKYKTIVNDVVECGKEIRAAAAKHREEIVEESISRYEDMYRLAREIGDVKEARQQQRAKEDVIGIHKQDALVQVNTVNLSSVPTEELLQIKKILKKNQ